MAAGEKSSGGRGGQAGRGGGDQPAAASGQTVRAGQPHHLLPGNQTIQVEEQGAPCFGGP